MADDADGEAKQTTLGEQENAAESDAKRAATDEGTTASDDTTATENDETPPPTDDADSVEVGVELLSKLERAELSVAEAVDRIETVTTHPATTRKILDEAEKRGVIDRENGIVKPTSGGGYVSFQSEIVRKEGDFSCRRCGAGLSTGHFIQLDAAEHGPFGPECIRKVTGRD